MANILPDMGLVQWNNTDDNFSHTDLANNFQKIDGHDHTAGKGPQIPSGGLANLSVGTAQLVDGAITDGKISASNPITDAKLASANNSTYKTIFSTVAKATAGVSTGKYLFGSGGTLVAPSVASSSAIVPVYYLNVNDYTVANKNPMLQVLVTILTNSVVPGITFTVGLNVLAPDPANATSGNMAWLVGSSSQIANSTAAIVTPAQNTASEQASVDFAFPATGFYGFVLNLSSTPGAGSVSVITTQLRIRNT